MSKHTLPSFRVYGNYSSDNYGAHALMFTDAQGTDYYFSYKTLVAVQRRGDSAPIVRENDWGPTTGKHLNAIDGGNKKTRIKGAAFEAMFSMVMA